MYDLFHQERTIRRHVRESLHRRVVVVVNPAAPRRRPDEYADYRIERKLLKNIGEKLMSAFMTLGR